MCLVRLALDGLALALRRWRQRYGNHAFGDARRGRLPGGFGLVWHGVGGLPFGLPICANIRIIYAIL